MKYLMALCLIWPALLVTAFTQACDVGGPCTCPRPCQAAIVTEPAADLGGVTLPAATDLEAAAKLAVEAALVECDRHIERTALLGKPTETICFSILNTVSVLHDLGVPDDALWPLVHAQRRIDRALEVAKPAHKKGLTIAQYALVMVKDAEGQPCQMFQAAALLCRANVYFKTSADALEDAQKDVAEAKGIAMALFKALEVPDEESEPESIHEPLDTDDAYDAE